jgi:hypothetical protein
MTLMDRIWEVVGPTIYLTREHYERCWRGWTIEGYERGGELVGATLVNGPEFHFVLFNPDKPITLTDVRHCLAPVLAAHGHVITRTPHHDTRQHRFNRVAGFRQIGGDEFNVIYRMEAAGSRWLR